MNKKAIKQFVIDMTIAAVIVVCFSMVVKPTVVRGESMDDTLHDGNYLMVSKLAYKKSSPKAGDIIVIASGFEDEKLLIKRVIAVGGETVETNGKVTKVNGKVIDEPYIKKSTVGEETFGKWEVPDGCVFVMGDNRDISLDSRDPLIGCVVEEDIVGKVKVRLFPFNQVGTVD